MQLTKRPVLVLNASYEPINICEAKRALVLLLKGSATLEEADELFVRPSMSLPLVIRLVKYHKVPQQRHPLSRKNVMLRDQYCCQYCGEAGTPTTLTLDHVIPRSRGGAGSWENLVACCFPCNNKKGNRTPEEAGMTLARKPRPMSFHTHRHVSKSHGQHHRRWEKYMFH